MISNHKDAIAARESLAQPDNVVQLHRISTEEMADDLTCDLSVIADRIREYESDIAALKRLRDTKASQLECCIRALGRQP